MFSERLSIQNSLYSGFARQHDRLQRAQRPPAPAVRRVKTYGEVVAEKCRGEQACSMCSYYLSNNLATTECQHCHHQERC